MSPWIVDQKIIISSMIFPPIIYFAIMIRGRNIYVDQHEHYLKRSSRNRFTILSPNGPQCLSIPLKKGKNDKRPMHEVKISYDLPWEKKFVRAIKTAYGSAPFYPYYIDEVERLLNQSCEKLIEFNDSVFISLSKLINIDIELKHTNKYYDLDSANVKLIRDVYHHENHVNIKQKMDFPMYEQVFSDRYDFVPNLSILDLIFCIGPESGNYLLNLDLDL